jgi:putative membrane protein
MSVLLTGSVLDSLLFAGVGIVTLIVAFLTVELLTPKHNLFKEIFDKQNKAVSILVGFFLLSLALIIAASIHG